MCLCLQALVSRAQQVRRAACIQRAVSEKNTWLGGAIWFCVVGVGVAATFYLLPFGMNQDNHHLLQ